MRLFYLLKLLQATVAVFVLWKILGTSELCSQYVSEQILEQRLANDSCKGSIIQLAATGAFSSSHGNISGAIHDSKNAIASSTKHKKLAQIFEGVLDVWDSITGYGKDSTSISDRNKDKGETDRINRKVNRMYFGNGIDTKHAESDHLKVKNNNSKRLTNSNNGYRQCIQVNYSDFIWLGSKNLGNASSVLRLFAAPIYCLLCFLIVTVLHMILKGNKKYKTCDYLSVVVCGSAWLFIFVAMLTINYNWNGLWTSMGVFLPEMINAVDCTKIVSLCMILFILLEGTFCKYLQDDVHLRSISNEYYVNEPADDNSNEYLLADNEWLGLNVEEKCNVNSVAIRQNMHII